MKKNTDTQKKELIFRILDDLKAGGEKINADKVAKLAQMGKQTVLPYYNDWRFLDQAEKQDEDCELPLDLIRVLKRMLVEWKQEVSGDLLKAEQDSEELKGIINQLTEQNHHLSSDIDHKEEKISHQNQHAKELEAALNQKDQVTVALSTELDGEKRKNADLKQQLVDLQSRHEQECAEKENKLDLQYRNQIDHWMKALDDERLQTAKLAKEIEQLRVAMLAREKEKNTVETRLNHKTEAYIEACEERNHLRSKLKTHALPMELLSRLLIILDANQENITEKAKTLVISEQHCKALKKEEQRLKTELENKNEQLNQAKIVELELEKSKGYIAALESTLNRLPKEEGN